MSRSFDQRFLRFVILAASFIAIPVFAQFEIAPDHFDGGEQKPAVQKSTAAKKTRIAQAAAPRPATHAVATPSVTSHARRNGSTRTQQIRQLKPNGVGAAK